MADMAGAAVTLGQAMGQGPNKSLDDLITALGRSSPLILDNLGLTVKVGEANKEYAEAARQDRQGADRRREEAGVLQRRDGGGPPKDCGARGRAGHGDRQVHANAERGNQRRRRARQETLRRARSRRHRDRNSRNRRGGLHPAPCPPARAGKGRVARHDRPGRPRGHGHHRARHGLLPVPPPDRGRARERHSGSGRLGRPDASGRRQGLRLDTRARRQAGHRPSRRSQLRERRGASTWTGWARKSAESGAAASGGWARRRVETAAGSSTPHRSRPRSSRAMHVVEDHSRRSARWTGQPTDLTDRASGRPQSGAGRDRGPPSTRS